MISFVVRRPVATWMIAIALAVFGWVSLQRLALDLMPDLAYPTITVRTEVPGYAPEEVESQISRPVEEALATTSGLVELESRSRAGISDVVLEFGWGTAMDDAAQDIRERLQTTFLPTDAERPLILRYDPSLDPIMRVALTIAPGSELARDPARSLTLLREVAEQELKRELEALDGVAAVRVRGGLEREVLVELREDWLSARDVEISQVVGALASENVNLPGGAIRDGDHEYLVRTLGEVRTTGEIEAIEIRRPDGVSVPISQVGTVREAHKDREVVSRLDGQEAVELEIYKAADANIVRVAGQLMISLGQVAAPPTDGPPVPTLAERLPDGVSLAVLENQATFIESSLDNLTSTAFTGAMLAIVVLFLFLRNFRATVIIGTAIPLSIICTFAPLYLGGVSLNLMSMGGLALGIGMLVDNAVVVLENIQVHLDKGTERKQAAIDGASEVAAAVTASTLTTVCVFLPIAFVEGIAGQVFGDLALAVVYSLLASLMVALLFVPMLAATGVVLPGERPSLKDVSRAAQFHSFAQLKTAWRGRSGIGRWLRLPYWLVRWGVRLGFELLVSLIIFPLAFVARLAAGLAGVVLPRLARLAHGAGNAFQAVYGRLDNRYRAWMRPALARPGVVLGAAALTVAVAIPVGSSLGQALIPELHQGRFTAELALPVGTPLSRTIDLVQAAEPRLQAIEGVAHVHTIVGTERRADSRPDEGEHTARMMVQLTPGGDLPRREAAAMIAVRHALADTPGSQELGLRMARPSLFSFATPVEVVLYDSDLGRLGGVAGRVKEALSELPGLTDVRSSIVAGYPEVRIRYDRALLQRYGLTTMVAAERIRDKVQGAQATSLSRGDGRVDLTVRLTEDERRSVEHLRRININPNVVPPIPLEAVASFEDAEGPSEIRRVDQRRAAAVSANLEGFDLSGQGGDILAAMAQVDTEGVEWELAGQNREMQRSLTSLQLALALAVFLVYVIMASTFESFLDPFVILFSVPLAFIGVAFALFFTGNPISVVVFIGAIVLAGVVVNNAIVLVDTIQRQRDAGLPKTEAIHAAAALRLRPILITTTTTVLGLLPLALGVGEGAEIQGPLALTIIAGLTSATLLTLVVIPVVYQVLTGVVDRLRPEPAP